MADLQVPACDRCSQGVMDSTNPHLLGTCSCECHAADRPEIEEARRIAEGAASPDGAWPMPEQVQRLASAFLDLLGKQSEPGMCPTCGEWAGRGKGCEWCSEFAQESGWNAALAPLPEQSEEEA